MPTESIGVAVIGAGMAGQAHAHGYHAAPTVFGPDLPPVRLVSIADLNHELAAQTARRYGFERVDSDWRSIATAPDIDVVSIVVANDLHREIVTELAAHGKHVLCEKPLAPSVRDARAMIHAVDVAGTFGRVGFTFRRSPAINAIREQIAAGRLGRVRHFSGQYWTDYACSPEAPMSWRYRGGPGSGALADLGSHLTDLAEFLCGRIEVVRGSILTTDVAHRPEPLGQVIGHQHTAVSDQTRPVENEDWASFCAEFASGATANISASRAARGHPNTLQFEVFCEHGAAAFDQSRPAEFSIATTELPAATNGYRRVLIGNEHPYVTGGSALDGAGLGFSHDASFVFQARAFLEEVAGEPVLERCASFEEGLHSLTVQDAVVSAAEREPATAL